jgi:large subunit ribosomal protein L22
MDVKAITRNVRISAFKCREVTREIQGRAAGDALDVLRFSPLKAARLVTKTLQSAIANAENNNNLKAGSLFVKEAVVGEGPTFKRFRAKARGSAGSIRKRTSHIFITVTDEAPVVPEKPAPRRRAAKEAPAATES